MIFNKDKKAISKVMAMGILGTSMVPVVALNENVEAKEVRSTSQQEKTTKVVEVTCSALNIRKGPSKDYSIAGTVTKGTKLKYISTSSNGWYKVEYKGSTRYISNNYSRLKSTSATSNENKDTIKKVGKITCSALNVRKGPGTNYGVKKTIKKGSVVGVIKSYSNGWSKVKISNSSTGYVCSDHMKTYSGDSGDIKVKYTKPSTSSTTNKKIDKVVSTVKAQVGKPYIYGAAGPNSFDCSGLTYYSYKKAGIYLNRSSRDQASNGKYVSKSNLKPGDLIFFNSGTNSIRHVGMYVGNNKFVHSPSPGKTVRYESLSTSYYVKGYVTARRIID
ncbi:MAG: NlpC/P60 family protein [Terrisporobacter othiniensis]|uniref:C40 family peptidase n=1 Tax=Terrisporobacter petrolearius TaxID=1460447 RepID=UPI0022E55293|nr:C40 family peptidase [Terrisporobacter petrolearius]MDU4860455.1 NlpC/P60 family protein [Terrisporobacter othiniensis]MDU6993316.1 NlpC/P60 family protein [Terrisporobacter othiniensis]